MRHSSPRRAAGPPSLGGKNLPRQRSRSFYLKPDAGVAEVNLVTSLQLHAASGCAWHADAAPVAKDADAASAVIIADAEFGAPGVVPDVGVLARDGCLRGVEGQIVAAAQPFFLANHFFQTAD